MYSMMLVFFKNVSVQRREEPRRARGGQDVTRTGHIVAERLGRILPEEDRARVVQVRQQLARVFGHDLEMLGRDHVRHPARVLQILKHDRAAVVLHALADDVPPRQRSGLPLHLRADGLRLRHRVGQQHGGGQPVVLGLAEQVGRDPDRVGRAVGNDQHLSLIHI